MTYYYLIMRITNPIGKKGEDLAVEYLKKKGYKILERNFQGRQGEIDIIALQQVQGKPSQVQNKPFHELGKSIKENVLVFVEVKTRRSAQFGTPLESIRHTKLSSIEITGQLYKLHHSKLPEAMRIDAVAVELDELGSPTKIEHLENIGGF